jgi:hypothetical protein
MNYHHYHHHKKKQKKSKKKNPEKKLSKNHKKSKTPNQLKLPSTAIDSKCKVNKKSVSDQTSPNLGFFLVESVKRKPKLTFCIRGSGFVPHVFEIIDDKPAKKRIIP